ncbi:unnamed protein product [Orchesella dallaii]|uniref:Transmembrane protein n=1 Tax=Orchesella dallaii TaxID=48710 RepID=A0ABP1Q1M6_9HEXA
MRKSEEGGVACGICQVSLQQASYGFGVADMVHGLLGIAVVMSMLIKKENDVFHKQEDVENIGSQEKISGYTKFLDEQCPFWLLFTLLGVFVFQASIGLFLCIGASLRNGILCMLWILGSLATPMTICLVGIGRIYQWATVGEFIWHLMNENESKYFTLVDGDTDLGKGRIDGKRLVSSIEEEEDDY